MKNKYLVLIAIFSISILMSKTFAQNANIKNTIFSLQNKNPAYVGIKNQPTFGVYEFVRLNALDNEDLINPSNYFFDPLNFDIQVPFENKSLAFGFGYDNVGEYNLQPTIPINSHFFLSVGRFAEVKKYKLRFAYQFDWYTYEDSTSTGLTIPDITEPPMSELENANMQQHKFGIAVIEENYFGGISLVFAPKTRLLRNKQYFNFNFAYNLNISNKLSILSEIYTTDELNDLQILKKQLYLNPYLVINKNIWIKLFNASFLNNNFNLLPIDILYKLPKINSRFGLSIDKNKLTEKFYLNFSLQNTFNIKNIFDVKNENIF